MKEITTASIIEKVRGMCIEANNLLPQDVSGRIRACFEEETWAPAKDTLGKLLENVDAAREKGVPICQDTGLACVFLELGQEVHIVGGNLYEAVHEGVRQGYKEGYLRKSVVADPLRRKNTGDNTPALITTDIVPGDKLTITVGPKGAGSENMSRLAMFPPAKGEKGVKDFVVETVQLAGPNPCPPIVVGVGIGGNFDKVALLAKKALMRSTEARNSDEYYAAMEIELLERINKLGIGPQGFGGRTTALAVNIEACPTHIACLPVAVNINCHVTRHVKAAL
ncbi:MAG: fumarate hydratase [Synergistaceae bacterium]|nr:fumarate hydratase [Synergistaceae bacterium]